MIPHSLVQIVYLIAAVLFILGLKRLSSPATARQGNMLSGTGMLLAIAVTLLDEAIVSYTVIIVAVLVGAAIGLLMARTVKMTDMPQMVALLNGFGGGASLVVAGAEFLRAELFGEPIHFAASITIQLALVIGAVTLTGSLVAFAKLQELLSGRQITFPAQQVVNGTMAAVMLGLAGYQVVTTDPHLWPFYVVVALALVLGVMLVIPIGGADMPVVISLLNSYSGIAAAMTGFVINNHVLIIAGALVGSSGLILSQIMCKAMNRSLVSVLFGAFGGAAAGGPERSSEGLTVKEITAEDLSIQLAYARRVIVVPGYGLAVAQAQHQVRELAELIEQNGGSVRYAIHPVAGRMPGHMNVLLSEAGVEYDKLITDVEDANAALQGADLALVVGSNDIVNPDAKDEPSSPLYGMPIIDVRNADRVVVMKRTMAAGFAGVDNPLFFHEKNWMLFGDAKKSISALVQEVKQEIGAGV